MAIYESFLHFYIYLKTENRECIRPESFLHFYIYLKTENRECIRPNIHKTRILPKVGNMTLLPNPGKPGFYGVGLPGRVIWCQPWL